MTESQDQPSVRLKRTAKGKRPQYFSDPAVDKLLKVSIELLGEMCVMRDRLDTVERLIEKHGLFDQANVDNFELSDELNEWRTQQRSERISRVLRAMRDELDSLAVPEPDADIAPPE